MARIPEAEIERLKKDVSLERVAEAKGVKLRWHGKDLLGLCPFHEDREPSLVISPEKNLWHCLGACQTGGSVIDWVMRAEGVSFRHAVEFLRGDFSSFAAFSPVKLGRQQGSVAKTSRVRKLPSPVNAEAGDERVMADVVDYYHRTLKESPEALEYLQKRGLESAEMIERFRLGFANRTLGYRLPTAEREDGTQIRGRLQALGIMRESGHEHMTGSLVIPIFDEGGRVTEMYGRKINDRLRPGTAYHLYLPGPHRGVWNIEALASSKEIILCEALIDALTFWCAGFRNVTSSYGVEGFTEDHLEAFRKYGTERVLIAYDRDEAGERAAEKLAAKLNEVGIECSRVLFPKGMDVNEYARKMQPATKALELVVRNAQWMGKGPRPTPADVTSVPATPDMVAHATNDEEQVERREVEGNRIIVEYGTKTIVADADGVVLEEIEHAPASEEPTKASEVPAPILFSAAPSSVTAEPVPTTRESGTTDEVLFQIGDRKWRVRGLEKNTALSVMKVNVLVSREGAGFHVDTLELYSARQRAAYITMAAVELGVEERVLKKDLGELLLKLEGLQEKKLEQKNDPREPLRPKLTEEEERAALALLRDPKLLDRILDDFERCGVVGERTNKLMGYLAATSRKLDAPLAVVIQSSSAAGKSSLMDAVLELMPEEDRSQYSAMTGQSLFYLGESNIRHKILAIVEEEGAERASYALKLLQSEGELTIASTGKDPVTGRLVTQEYRVEGPVMIFLTTTAIEVDEELLNRCIVLTVDEGREQTRAIHARQRAAQTLEGVLAKQAKEHVMKVHRDAQRLLRPLLVVNPYAHELRFSDAATRTRRDHMKYLTLIRSIAFLHQHQRAVKAAEHRGQSMAYIEVTREDIATANQLCHEVLGRSLDELPPQTRRLLGLLEEMVREGCERHGVDREDFRFSRREVRERTKWGNTQLKIHLGRLLEMEYVLAHRGKQGQGYVYELCYEGQGKDGTPFLSGLLEVGGRSDEAATTISTSRGSAGYFAGGGRPLVGGVSGGGRGIENVSNIRENGSISNHDAKRDENARRETSGANGSRTSYVSQEEVCAAVSARA